MYLWKVDLDVIVDYYKSWIWVACMRDVSSLAGHDMLCFLVYRLSSLNLP